MEDENVEFMQILDTLGMPLFELTNLFSAGNVFLLIDVCCTTFLPYPRNQCVRDGSPATTLKTIQFWIPLFKIFFKFLLQLMCF